MRPIAILLAASLAGAGCGGEDEEDRTAPPAPARADAAEPAPPPPPVRCPTEAANCRSADGRILYVERVDPDGDGDAHFVLASDESVTAPGITVVDVRRDLWPSPLPGAGQLVSAAGPVYRGSLGQRQIQADVVRVAGP